MKKKTTIKERKRIKK